MCKILVMGCELSDTATMHFLYFFVLNFFLVFFKFSFVFSVVILLLLLLCSWQYILIEFLHFCPGCDTKETVCQTTSIQPVRKLQYPRCQFSATVWVSDSDPCLCRACSCTIETLLKDYFKTVGVHTQGNLNRGVYCNVV